MLTRATVRPSSSWLIDAGVFALLAALLSSVVQFAKHWEAPLQPQQVEISLSVWALPGYALFSLLRGFAAYGLSLLFALAYGYYAAHHPRAERVMIPLLDVLQSIPVLGFLPGAVLAFVAMFPGTHIGLELASILMIFTGQVWNMTFSFYHSLRAIPQELREACAAYRFNWWQRFRRVELPAGAVSLAWNSMTAMAGGWFFLMICEAFTLGAHSFRLPGLGTYMSVAVAQHNGPAMIAGIVAMAVMIVLVDMCLWRPVLVWVQKFRMEETASAEVHSSMVLNWLKRSWLAQEAMARVAHPISEWLASSALPAPSVQASSPSAQRRVRWVTRLLGALVIGASGATVVYGAWRLAHLLLGLSLGEWWQVLSGSMLTLARVSAAVVLGSLWAVPVGIWIGRSERLRRLLQPVAQIIASFPAPMLYPLVILLFHGLGLGLGVGAVALMLLGTQWYILFNVIAGATAVPTELREAAQAYQFSSRQRWRVLWWPAIFPYVITGWVTAAGGAWNASIVAEYVSVGDRVLVAPGLGSLISVAAGQGHYALLAAGVLMMVLIVIGVNHVVWKPLARLAEVRYGL